MRRYRRIRSRIRIFSALGLILLAGAGRALGDEGFGAFASEPAESAAVWLPDTPERMDEPERLAVPRGAARLRLLTSRGGAGLPARRLWWGSRRGEGALSFNERLLEGGALVRGGSFTLSGGSFAIQDPGLVAEVAGLARRTRAVGVSRRADARIVARPATGAACDLEGAAIGWNGHVGVAGGTRRRDVGEALAVEGLFRPLTVRAILVRAWTRRELYGSIAIRRSEPGRLASAEAGAGPLGPFGRLGLEAREGRLEGAARYQLEPWRDRPGTLDLEGAWASRNVAARVRWRSWSGPATPRSAASAPEDDGRVEVDLRLSGTRSGGAGACRLRVGSKPRQADGSGGERFFVGDWIVARERGRTLRFITGRRDVQTGSGWRRGRSAGSLLDLEWGARAAMTLSVEAVRADGDGGSYGPGLDVAETGSLRARTRSGVRAGARGWIRIGAWRLGAAADDEDDGTEFDETISGARRAPRVTLWLAWSGGEFAP